jgi:hypothetical protein
MKLVKLELWVYQSSLVELFFFLFYTSKKYSLKAHGLSIQTLDLRWSWELELSRTFV